MIAKLSGIIDSFGTDWVILDVGGVGYLVYCSGRTLRRLGGVGEAASLRVETHVREDAIVLYGFADLAERDWFRLLTTVQGVGARVALSILTTLGPDQLAQALAAQDKKLLSTADGVGPKLANRIASELKDKAAGMAFAVTAPATVGEPFAPVAEMPAARGAAAEAISALVNLGYRRAEAFGAVTAVVGRLGTEASLDHLIRESLRELSL